MQRNIFLLIVLLISFSNNAMAQTGPWAKYDAKMKGEALIREADGGYLKEVQSIVEGGGDVNWQMASSGLTPLMAAAAGDYVEVVKFLLDKGAEPNRKDANGRTALERAQLVGAKKVTPFLSQKKSANIIPPDNQKPEIDPTINTVSEKPTTFAVNKNLLKNNNSQSWARFGTYGIGDKVKFFIGTWKEGTVIKVGSPGNYSIKNAAPEERKYLISREGASNWNEWMDWGNVTGLNREEYWTRFFVGIWQLGETMAINTRTDGAYQRDEYSFHAANETLRINENKTYLWKTMDGKNITGNWNSADDGAGILLLKAYRGFDWVLRNETNAAEENIRGLQSARLTTKNQMSVAAKRPL